ncbi:hypothetical protein EDB83DRAFT_2325622 [Lactarius deliciosus]|nr:hypothetical protein EDB83DRAFT_2325622 [Lactarius deliciosus]
MLIIFCHLHIPGSSKSPVQRIGRAALSLHHCLHLQYCITFNTHEGARGLQPVASDDLYLPSTCNKYPPRRTPLVTTATASPARTPVAASSTHPLPRESTVTATPSRRAGPITTPSQHGVQAPFQTPTTPQRRRANPTATSTQHGAQIPPRRKPQTTTMEATGDGSNMGTTTTRR